MANVSEERAYTSLIEGCSATTRDKFGLEVWREGSIVAMTATAAPQPLILNRVFGLEEAGHVDPTLLTRIDNFYQGQGVGPYAIDVRSDGCSDRELRELLAKRGFIAIKRKAMLYRGTARLEHQEEASKVCRVKEESAERFAAICDSVFRHGEAVRVLLVDSFAQREWAHWLVFDGSDEPYAAGACHLCPKTGVAWFGWACTLPDYRRRGAQSALAVARMRHAFESGARWVTLEAAVGRRGEPSVSFRNCSRLGWQVACEKTVFVRRPR